MGDAYDFYILSAYAVALGGLFLLLVISYGRYRSARRLLGRP